MRDNIVRPTTPQQPPGGDARAAASETYRRSDGAAPHVRRQVPPGAQADYYAFDQNGADFGAGPASFAGVPRMLAGLFGQRRPEQAAALRRLQEATEQRDRARSAALEIEARLSQVGQRRQDSCIQNVKNVMRVRAAQMRAMTDPSELSGALQDLHDLHASVGALELPAADIEFLQQAYRGLIRETKDRLAQPHL